MNSNESTIIKEAKVQMIDEVSMIDLKTLDLIDRYLRVLMNNDKPMEGKVAILMHDFKQILPVILRGSRASIVSSTIMCSDAWENFTQETLTEKMRVKHTLMEESNAPKERKRCLSKYSE